ncbi:uncharacterized mitochondrial protein AtMg00810-like [Hibiscus syriacus]|uniref:uncharacterized mitochondrial protein AtMg00810-like n=1 Tax=Hibiscus syriacus TaxID=106335 RepID=UPI0019233BAB|nr:uncharacterized mitochondrial protein AtMg00810-like [Hibiscus syriacus]
MDVYNAFLQGGLVEEVYMTLPDGFCIQGESKGSDIAIFLVYVDDLLITRSSEVLIAELKHILNKKFKMKDLGELKYFLGLEVLRSKVGIVLNQRKYGLELIEETGAGGAKPAMTPLEQNKKLTTTEYDEARLIGILIYLTHTRPDIVYAVHFLSQFMHKPKQSHLEAALRVVKYIKKNPGQGILLSATSECRIFAYCDSDWAVCPMTRRYVTGFCVKLGMSLISWKSKKHNTVARSSAEAEYRSMVGTAAKIVWLRGLLAEMGLKNMAPAKLMCDSKAALQIAANPVFHERTKHIKIDCHFVRENIQEGLIQTEHIKTGEQQADLMTKALGVHQHEYIVSKLGFKDVFATTNLRGREETVN